MEIRNINFGLIVFVIGFLWLANADAAIYKWRDKNGKIHFTDDPTKVPEAFRKKPFIRNPKAQTPELKKKQASGEEGEVTEKESVTDQPADLEKKEGEEGLTEAQRSTAEAVVGFLNVDIPRYEKFNSWPASRSKFRLLKEAVAGATPQKQALLGQVSSSDLPLFKEIAEFLKTSITEDEQAQKVLPTTITSRRQTQALTNRLKSEAGKEKQLLEKLTEALAKAKEVKPVSELPPTSSVEPSSEKELEKPVQKEKRNY